MLGILIVSHSEDAARGIEQIAAAMAGEGYVEIRGVGGNDDGGLGVSVSKIHDALLLLLTKTENIIIIPDLGSSVLSSRGAIGMLSQEETERVVIADVPTLEGAMLAAVEASGGSSVEQIVKAAEEARHLKKLDH